MKTTMVINKGSGHLCRTGCGCGKHKTPQRLSLVQQVEAELKRPGNERVIATVNEETGHVATFVAPKPPCVRSNNLTPEQRNGLEAARKQLIQSLRLMVWRDRVLAQDRIRAIESELGLDRSNRGAERRSEEREVERRRQRGEPG